MNAYQPQNEPEMPTPESQFHYFMKRHERQRSKNEKARAWRGVESLNATIRNEFTDQIADGNLTREELDYAGSMLSLLMTYEMQTFRKYDVWRPPYLNEREDVCRQHELVRETINRVYDLVLRGYCGTANNQWDADSIVSCAKGVKLAKQASYLALSILGEFDAKYQDAMDITCRASGTLNTWTSHVYSRHCDEKAKVDKQFRRITEENSLIFEALLRAYKQAKKDWWASQPEKPISRTAYANLDSTLYPELYSNLEDAKKRLKIEVLYRGEGVLAESDARCEFGDEEAYVKSVLAQRLAEIQWRRKYPIVQNWHNTVDRAYPQILAQSGLLLASVRQPDGRVLLESLGFSMTVQNKH